MHSTIPARRYPRAPVPPCPRARSGSGEDLRSVFRHLIEVELRAGCATSHRGPAASGCRFLWAALFRRDG